MSDEPIMVEDDDDEFDLTPDNTGEPPHPHSPYGRLEDDGTADDPEWM